MNAEATLKLREFGAAEWPLLNHKGRLARLCRLLPWSGRRVRAVYNGEQGVSLRANEQADVDALTEEANQNAFAALQDRVARLEAALAAVDQEFFDPQMVAYRQAVHAGRGGDVTSADGEAE